MKSLTDKPPSQIPIKGIVWQNGMLMVFDENGKQVPNYQGEAKHNLRQLLEDFPKCEIEGSVWNV